MSHVTYYEQVMSHMNASCHTCHRRRANEGRAIVQIRMSQVTITSHMDESRHTWMSHVTHVTGDGLMKQGQLVRIGRKFQLNSPRNKAYSYSLENASSTFAGKIFRKSGVYLLYTVN